MINSYLTFNGNCREAMTFYQQCLGGDLNIQTIGESPIAGKMPGPMKDRVLHATLVSGSAVLMGSDMVPENGLQRGNSVSLVLQCKSEAQIRYVYDALAAGGSADHPLEQSFFGALFGDLTDKYGNHWLLNFEFPKDQDKQTK